MYGTLGVNSVLAFHISIIGRYIYIYVYVYKQERVQRAEGTSQLQDRNMERKDLGARRQIGELENGNAEE
jgi:hypothetical protein